MGSQHTSAPVRVFILDDHEIVRRGIVDMIDSEPGLTIVGEAAHAAEAVRGIRDAEPDVAVLDISLGAGGTGFEVCRSVTREQPGVACVIFTAVVDDRALVDAYQAGAAAFSLKSIGSNDLIDTIRAVAAGARLIDHDRVGAVEQRLWDDGFGRLEHLTDQELRIVELLGRGWSNRQIGVDLILAEKTVKNYVSRLLSKMEMDRRTELAALAGRMEERDRAWQRLTSHNRRHAEAVGVR